ncbi:aerotolerance regulator BatA [Photobacterium leiognathi subsp. mandapamensis]|uniref:vWA domain-containing protein n=1 Tax=Photobacterium leiognathi TaxID=553611 RepID=UPI000D163E32|nr:VWA domain-containing protein [Photobacterium leiognathi]PSV04146.1 aerotolerance regulator BatA [Photobacterium leiognathi subsp. mandapamensis]
MDFSLTDIELVHPLWLLLLPLPLLIHYFLPGYKTKQKAIKVPYLSQLIEGLDLNTQDDTSLLKPSRWQKLLLCIAWCFMVFALTKPTILGEPQTREKIGRDVMVVVDLSGSMAEKDFKALDGKSISRLDAVKKVLAEFSQHRKGDRLGLILFGDAAFVQTPFTSDHQVWLSLLNETQVGMAGQSTYLGDAIGLTIKRFELHADKDNAPREKVAIVLTDGNDTNSVVPPLEAAKIAKAKGVRIHMIAVGDPLTVGEQALDMDIIDKVASLSGGKAFTALNRDELVDVYNAINKLEPQRYQSTTYRPKQSIHHYVIISLLVIYLLMFGRQFILSWRNKAY